MMMMRTAGGPPPVSPLDFTERKTPFFTRTTWIALGVVGAAHIGVGAVLFAQRFELAPPTARTPDRIIETILFERPKPPPPKTPPTTEPPAPNTKTNPLPAPPTATETVAIETGDKIAEGPVISTQPVEEAEPTGTAVEPTPPTLPAKLIRNPSWQSRPSAEQMMRAYPDRALRMGIGGTVGLNCLVEASGRVGDCNIAREEPAGNGFGRAAQGLSRYFQVNPRTVDGAAEGSRVNITLRFTAPD